MTLDRELNKRIAGLELNALNLSEAAPLGIEGGRLPTLGTPIYDINGELLFRRYPITKGRRSIGYTDVAANEQMGEPLLAVTTGRRWSERAIVRDGVAAARRLDPDVRFDRVRFVAYSFPKIALQFQRRGREVLMLEWLTWAEVPSADLGDEADPYFRRSSYLDEMSSAQRRRRTQSFERRIEGWAAPELRAIDPRVITTATFQHAGVAEVLLVDTREVHYSPRPADHHPCYELRGQQTGTWCVAASVEMLLNFYRYQYTQPRLADELDLGTCDDDNGLPYGDEHRVVTVIEKLSANTLDATMYANPSWTVHRNEIRKNRPLISFVPQHSRTVVGYTQSNIHLLGEVPYKGLLVYDPWPPTTCALPEQGGAITTWENFNTQTYRFAFAAELQHV
ncbi:MAG: hypothetical protein GY788_07910 [bacterium]|nr:hypothetical protein [bacterium]